VNDINEENAMSRLVGSVLGLVLVLVVGQPARAQAPGSVYGGFGLNYMQPVRSGSYVLDRWWMVQPTPIIGATVPPPAMVRQPVVQPTPAGRLPRSARATRSFGRLNNRPMSAVSTATPLPTGSLYWPAGVGAPLYSPAQRYATYGQGYGVGPYGVVNYNMGYKGMYWGN
jgi:hypothetical protein